MINFNSKKQYKTMFTTINYLIKKIYDNSDDYDDKYLTVKINLDNDISLEKTLENIIRL